MSKRRFKSSADPRDTTDDPPMSRLFVVCSKTTSEDDFRNSFAKFGEFKFISVSRILFDISTLNILF